MIMYVQVPLLPVYYNLSIHPASFLSKMLPSAADKYIPASFVQEVMLCLECPVSVCTVHHACQDACHHQAYYTFTSIL